MTAYDRGTPDGTRDWLFEECRLRRQAEAMLSQLYEQRGFSEVMTPGIELLDVFEAGRAALPVEDMYKLVDSHGRLLVLRPDSTLPIARLTAARLKDAPLPVRLYYAQDVYRLHHGMTGRRDQQFQVGVELIGAAGARADLEVLELAARSLCACGVGDFRLEIGHVAFVRALVDALDTDDDTRETVWSCIETKNYVALGETLDGLGDQPAARAVRRLPRLFGGEEVLAAAGELCGDPAAHEALTHVSWLYRQLCALGLSEQVRIDLGLVHRNDYYTGVIFRGYIEGSGDTVVTGGRYDSLLRQFGADHPATGFGVNVDALIQGLQQQGHRVPGCVPSVLVHAQTGCEGEALARLRTLQEQGETVEFSVLDTLEQARAYAQRRGIGRVETVGEKGAAEG